jgi:hypothetical protein
MGRVADSGHPYRYADLCGPAWPDWQGDPAQLTHGRLVLDVYPTLSIPRETWQS